MLLVGGQSRMPLVHQKVAAFFGKQPSRAVHPDEAVAIGAALLAHSLGSAEGVVLIDVLPMSIGIGLPGGRVKTIIERNTPLPARKQYGLATTRDGQTEFELVIVQGESPDAAECEYLGTVRLAGLPSGPARDGEDRGVLRARRRVPAHGHGPRAQHRAAGAGGDVDDGGARSPRAACSSGPDRGQGADRELRRPRRGHAGPAGPAGAAAPARRASRAGGVGGLLRRLLK